MSNRSYIAKEFATTNPELFIEVKVRYAGKPEYSGAEQQGYWMSIVPFKREEKDGCIWRTTAAYSGTKTFLEPATRYNERYMERIALDWEYIKERVGWIAGKANVELVEA